MPGEGTVGKALDVLDKVAAIGRPTRFVELLEQCALPKATLYRFLQTLTRQGMLVYDPERQTYALGLRLVRLAHAAWTQSSLAPLARPHIDALSRELGQTVHLTQLDNAQVLYVDKRSARDGAKMFSQAGKVGPAYCTGVGKAMLAFLPEDELRRALALQSFFRFTDATLTSEAALRAELSDVRRCGVALDREEHEPGIICVAAPILTARRRLLGALSVTGHSAHTQLSDLEAFAPRVIEAAAAIAREAEAWRFPEA